MKLTVHIVLLSILSSIFFVSSFAQLSAKNDTVICEIFPNERNEFSAYLEVAGNDSIDYRYELISENVTQLTSWEVEFCDCFECLIGLTDSGSCRIGPNESFSFKYYVTLPADVKEYTETYVSYRITNKADSTNVDTFTWITRKAPDAPEVSVGEYDVTRSEVNVFPNPTDGMVNISFEAISNDLYTLSVMNVLGEMVYTQVLEPTAGNNIASELDFSDLQKGAYFLTLSNGMEIKTERLTIK
ncbi:T9SS type A sorting domain-containing protein [Salibacteraceae bacterium]|nr:T9SS type A sorting domain-containing protein [Salibacteraceae bacterium]